MAELTIGCGASPELAEGIARGELDVAVVEAPVDEATGECLCVERLVWVGARGGNVHAKRPLPLSMVDESCAFRARVLKVLGEHGIEWRTVFESGNIEATTATVRTGLAVTAWLTPTVPADLDIIGPEAGLPELPMFAISLLLPAQGASAAAQALGQCIREGFSTRHRVGERRVIGTGWDRAA